ncbi:MAG: 2-amino-4-hydroxy-6-hydroxymethyldihydropteridine diphosphokinase [Microbacter sp.]
MPVCYIGIGSNLEDRNTWMNFAENQLQKYGSISRQSSRYVSKPWGFQSQHLFLNEVVALVTPLSPINLLKAAKEIEKLSRRTVSKSSSYQDRPLDIDLLFYDDLILESPTLNIPHAKIQFRRFVLVPLHEIAPQFIHPVLQQSVSQLLLNCPDTSDIYPDNTEPPEFLNYFII